MVCFVMIQSEEVTVLDMPQLVIQLITRCCVKPLQTSRSNMFG